MLADGQRELARVFGEQRGPADKFAGLRWSPCRPAPVLDGVLTWVGCAVETVHEAGDHHVVLGRVTELGRRRRAAPAAVLPGPLRRTAPAPADGPPELVDTLLAWPRHADWM